MKQPLITIVTICYNIADDLDKTMQSVINQTYENIEYIIVDGGSSDHSVGIIKRNEKVALQKNIVFKWVSEKDKGIYDAMNKGIDLATGKWINFMNAGDTFMNRGVLDDMQLDLYSDYALIYGNAFLGNKILQYPSDINKAFKSGKMMACHQAMFFNKDILQGELKYSTQYKYNGDYDLIVRLSFIYIEMFKYININVAIYQGGGVSFQLRNCLKIALEKKEIQLNYFGTYSKKAYLKSFLGYMLSYFPKFIQSSVRTLERTISDIIVK